MAPPNSSEVLERLRRLCLAFPGTLEVIAWGHPNFRAGKRTFAVFEVYRDRPCIAVKVGHALQQCLVADAGFFITPYIGKHGWVSVWTDRKLNWRQIKDLVARSYSLVTGKSASTKKTGQIRRPTLKKK